MTALREDLYRALLGAFSGAASMSGESIETARNQISTEGLSEWYRFELASYVPDRTAATYQQATGTMRVLCLSRLGADDASVDVSGPDAMVDKVVSALENQDVQVIDHSAGGGSTLTGIAQTQEVQTDDLSDAQDGVYAVVCTIEYVLMAIR